MSFDKIKNFLRTASEITQQPSSILEKTSTFISSSFRRTAILQATTTQFDSYLATLSSIKRSTKKNKSNSANTLKPELVQHCNEVVDREYFNEQYEIDQKFFDKRKKVNQQRQINMHEQLDEVQVCLFNQITSRFDEILSVLRTIQSLDCLVTENQKKLRTIRQNNFKKVLTVAQKQNKMAILIRRKKNIQLVLQLSVKLRQYRKLQQLQDKIDAPDTAQAYYSLIPTIKKNIEVYKKLKITRNAALKLDEIESMLKRSFSDKVNEKIMQYIKKDIPYQLQFWRKYINNHNIIEEKDQKDNSTALLDESTLMGQQQTGIIVIPKKEQTTQYLILQYLKKGWEDGEYSINKLKTDIDVMLKNKHNIFMLDFRNFCDEVCRKYSKNVDNPSLSNLLKEISITFCSKAFGYFFDIHKSMILRFFSLSRKIFQFLTNLTKNSLNIDQKQKISLIGEGFASSGAYLIRMILEKLVDILETKIIHEGISIAEIKQLMGVLENAQAFLEKQVQMVINIQDSKNTFLKQFFNSLQGRYPLKILEIVKKKKLMDYLNKMHKNALTVELKQSLENQVWISEDIPTFYYDSLHYLITGQSLNLRRDKHNLKGGQQSSMTFETSVLMDGLKGQQSFFKEPTKLIGNFRIIRNDITINGETYKVTKTLLLLLQILQDYMTLAQNFPILKIEIGIRINQLIRSYNVSSCQLIVYAGAIALQKIKSKMITSKHLALSSLCLKFLLYIMDCMSKRIEIMEIDKLRQSIQEHIDIIIKKLNQILIFKTKSAKPQINLKSTPSKGTQIIVSSTKILLQILSQYYGKEILAKIFTREYLNIYLDSISALQITNKVEAEALKDDIIFYYTELKALQTLSGDFEECRVAAEDVIHRAFEEL